jgi:hypothetical protein
VRSFRPFIEQALSSAFALSLALPGVAGGEQLNSEDPGRFPIYRVHVNDPVEGKIAIITFMSPSDIEKIGGLPPEIIVGRQVVMADGLDPDNFGRNRVFVDFLHAVVRETVPTVTEFKDFIRSIDEGWMNVQDGRTTLKGLPLPPEDLIGRYRVRNGRFVIGEYEPNPLYWVLTKNGMMTPHPAIVDALLKAMRALEFNEDSVGPSNSPAAGG